jgi:hypothetical protein
MLSFMAAFWTLGNLFVACESQDIELFLQLRDQLITFMKNKPLQKQFIWF